ncbi:3996_t:CDS:10 [Paraglomus occultum]|uniref:3996_t:CDS:1 n=1 Tax=Paraglomus occultum TaxID=144539 RepID=A0A9N9AKB6_9GLOM|nr:3996_t:CDS:10 [Paraglomus occultum]
MSFACVSDEVSSFNPPTVPETSESFVMPTDIHPVLQQMALKNWDYRTFVLQLIKSGSIIEDPAKAEEIWLETLRSLSRRKKISSIFRVFFKKLIEYQISPWDDDNKLLHSLIYLLKVGLNYVQKFVELDEETASALDRHADLCVRYEIAKSAEHMENLTKSSYRNYYVSKEISDHLRSKVNMKETKKTEKRIVILPGNDESDTSTSTSSEDDCEFGLKDSDLFTQRFAELETSKKWKLKSGTYVEDVLYELGMTCQYHNLVHSFILDPEDPFIKNAFTEEELFEIIEKKNGEDQLEIDDELLEYIDTFAKASQILNYNLFSSSTQEIREALNTPHSRLGQNYNPQTDFMYEHVRTTVMDWVRLLEMQPNPLTLAMPEGWYCVNVWRTIDIAFSDTPYTYVIGGEKVGVACTCSERKNRYRTLANVGPIQRKAIGKKGDAYVRTIGSTQIDWAVSEAGAKWEGVHGTKLMTECGLSLPRTLKDILVHLASKMGFAEQKLRKLNIVGFAHAGAILIRTNLDCPAGYICRYTRGEPLEVYANVKNFHKSLDVLVEIIYAKLLILQTMEVVSNDEKNSTNITRWKAKRKLMSDVTKIPDVHPTPKNKKQKTPNQQINR